MTETKEVNQSGDDISGSLNNNPDTKKKETVKEKHIEDKEVFKKKEEGEEDKENVEETEEGSKEEEVEEKWKDKEDEKEVVEKEEQEEGKEETEDSEDELENKLKPGTTDMSINGGNNEDEDEDTKDELKNNLEPGPVEISIDGGKVLHVEVALEKNLDKIVESSIHGNESGKSVLADIHVPEASVISNVGEIRKPAICDENGSVSPDTEQGRDVRSDAYDSLKDIKFGDETISRNQSSSLMVEQMEEEELKSEAKNKEGDIDVDGRNGSNVNVFDTDTSGGGESGTEDEQAAFTLELVRFSKERGIDFKPPKFYGEPLNLLKLWRYVLKLGGYDKVTTCKYWRQVGESFNPPKTCTTISWTFRIFYEKALLHYERYRASSDDSGIPGSLSVPENSASGSGRARRVAAARAMEGWHSQRILDNGEVSDPIVKDKNLISLSKKEKQLKNLGELKRKKPSSTDHAVKPVHCKEPKTQMDTTVIDIGSPADWVKINVRETKDCYEVYALVPGLLREEVRIQSDPAGRLVISGEPENPDNPWCVTPFKKVVSLPSRIDPHQTSAVVTLHGQLFVRVPFEQYD